MSSTRSSAFRDALQVSPERIAVLSDVELTRLMGQLLTAQAYRCRSPVHEIQVNTEEKAKDEGCDGWSAAPLKPDDWLGSTDACWQFKSGTAGQPARLRGEVTKPIPSATLRNGGRFVVVASNATTATSEKKRLSVLIKEAEEAGLPTARLDVIGTSRLSNWCNQHPAVAAAWAGRPSGLWRLDDWEKSPEHRERWHAPDALRSDLESRRAELDFETGSTYHLHIQGQPGVGKTRFALELCREAPWRSAVIYVRQAEDFRLLELIDSASTDLGVRLIVVADEAQARQLLPLRDSVDRADGRVRLVTIGHCPTPDSTRIPALSVTPLRPEQMREVVRTWHPSMPAEYIDFVVRFADGYVRLARLTAQAVARQPQLDVRRLLEEQEIRAFIDQMLGNSNREELYVLAALSRVGWTDDKQEEGEAIARHLGLDWIRVQTRVEHFDRASGIAPRGGRYRYISPLPLGIHLAVEAWSAFPDLMRSLPGALPSDDARESYYERLASIASNPQARRYAREELSLFFHVADFLDARAARRWAALAAADPERAARALHTALRSGANEERLLIEGQARRVLVWRLGALAWNSTAFREAMLALALLAEAENESWANNATKEFVNRFQIVLGGTAVPYLERLSVLDELLAENRISLTRLVIKALTQVGNRSEFRMDREPASDQMPEREWKPSTHADYFECGVQAVRRLIHVAHSQFEGLEGDLVAAASKLSMMLRESSQKDVVTEFFEAVRNSYPNSREPLRRIISNIVRTERRSWRELPEADVEALEALHARFEDSSLSARLHQVVGDPPWGAMEELDLRPLAQELLTNPEVLISEWPWLTSGEAKASGYLGEALAETDSDGELAETLPSRPGCGGDLRVLCGYVGGQRRNLGDAWYDAWLASQAHRDPRPTELLFEVAWRCGATEALVDILSETLRTEKVSPAIVGQLQYGRWAETLPFASLETLLRAMMSSGHFAAAAGILVHRVEARRSEADQWKGLSLELVTTSELIRSEQTEGYHWNKLAEPLIENHASEIVAAIFHEQLGRDSEIWFIEFTPAAIVLQACVQRDPLGMWEVIQPYLVSPSAASRLSIGFPSGVLSRVPQEAIWRWVEESPDERATTLARLIKVDLSTDTTLASRLLGEYGRSERVGSAFFSTYVTGSYVGPPSEHWNSLADQLEEVTDRTEIPTLKRWARRSAASLREMAEKERQREEEEDLLRR